MQEPDDTPAESVAFMKAAEMEKMFYTKREIADAFLTVAKELHPDA